MIADPDRESGFIRQDSRVGSLPTSDEKGRGEQVFFRTENNGVLFCIEPQYVSRPAEGYAKTLPLSYCVERYARVLAQLMPCFVHEPSASHTLC